MMNPPDHNPFASPLAEPDEVAAVRYPAGEPARRLTRLLASIVDTIIMSIGVLPFSYLLSYGFFDPVISNPELAAELNPWNPFATPEQAFKTVVSFVIGVGVFLAINGYWLHHDGQSVAKKMFGIRIVRKDGSKASLGRLIGARILPIWVISLVPIVGGLVGLLDALLIFRQSRYCLHDDIADTTVVTVESTPYTEPA